MQFADPDAFAHLSVRLRTAGPGRGRGGTPVLSIEGELDRCTVASPEWVSAVSEAVEQAGDVVVLDLRRLYLLDLAGLAEFEKLAASLLAAGRRLVLAAIRPRIREFLRQACADFGDEYTGLDELDAVAAGPTRRPTVARPAAAGLVAAA